MKLADLFEGPHHIEMDAPPPKAHQKAYPSYDGLARTCKHLGTLEKRGVDFNFWLANERTHAYVTTEAKDDIHQIRQLIITDLQFKIQTKLPVKNQLQVTWVYTEPEYVDRYLAGALYIVLARYENTVVSDSLQYNGGRKLWEKLATEADARKYVVRVWDEASAGWLKDGNGDPLKLNASELESNEIWTKQIEPTTLLALSHV
jgi:hypothetical protein